MLFKKIGKICAAACLVAALSFPGALLPGTVVAGTMANIHKGVDTAQDVDRAVSGSSHEPVHQGVDKAQDVAKQIDGTSTEQVEGAAKQEAVDQGTNALTNVLK